MPETQELAANTEAGGDGNQVVLVLVGLVGYVNIFEVTDYLLLHHLHFRSGKVSVFRAESSPARLLTIQNRCLVNICECLARASSSFSQMQSGRTRKPT